MVKKEVGSVVVKAAGLAVGVEATEAGPAEAVQGAQRKPRQYQELLGNSSNRLSRSRIHDKRLNN
jgi:hypothetical protein